MTSEIAKDLIGKVYVVTGANSGIGFSAVSNFANRGARVVMVCRNIDLGLEALDKIRSKQITIAWNCLLQILVPLQVLAGLRKRF